MKNEFLPQAKVIDNNLVLNNEAVETMNLDSDGSRVILLNVTNPDSKRLSKEMLIVKVNGSTLDNPADVAELISADKIRTVVVNKQDDGNVNVSIPINKEFKDSVIETFGKAESEFKLILVNTDNKVIKEFKDVFDISENCYRIAKMNDKRTILGKDKSLETKNEERLKL